MGLLQRTRYFFDEHGHGRLYGQQSQQHSILSTFPFVSDTMLAAAWALHRVPTLKSVEGGSAQRRSRVILRRVSFGRKHIKTRDPARWVLPVAFILRRLFIPQSDRQATAFYYGLLHLI